MKLVMCNTWYLQHMVCATHGDNPIGEKIENVNRILIEIIILYKFLNAVNIFLSQSYNDNIS